MWPLSSQRLFKVKSKVIRSSKCPLAVLALERFHAGVLAHVSGELVRTSAAFSHEAITDPEVKSAGVL